VIPLPIKQAIRNTAINWSGVAFRWQSGGVVLCDNWSSPEVAMAAFTTSEWKLARQLYATQPDDVVVADSAYGTYVDLALVRSVNADGVFRKHHARHCDFRRGKKLGLAIILSSGSVSAVPSIHECSGFCSVTSKH